MYDRTSMVVYNLDSDFPFKDMLLGSPIAIQGGGSYSAPISVQGSPVYIQFSPCTTKAGVVETIKNTYCDLIYPSVASSLASWVEKLESKCCSLIDGKKHLWFSNELTTTDIEGMITPVARPHKQCTSLLIRVQLDTKRGINKHTCKMFDENENELNTVQLDKDTMVIPLVHIEAVRFTSRSFDVVLKMVQLMLIKQQPVPQPVQQKACMIIVSKNKDSVSKTTAFQKSERLVDVDSDNIIHNLEEVDLDMDDAIEDDAIEDDANEDDVIEDDAIEDDAIDDDAIEDDAIEDDVKLDCIESLDPPTHVEGIQEIEIDIGRDSATPMVLKQPNEVYYDIYKAAIEKAKHMRKVAVEAYLEAKHIKSKYMLEDINDSDGEAELQKAVM